MYSSAISTALMPRSRARKSESVRTRRATSARKSRSPRLRAARWECCQKVTEAEALVLGGVRDVLIANEVVGAPKLRRLAALARQARVSVCVDDAGNVAALDAAVAQEFEVRLDVLIEVNVGANRWVSSRAHRR